MKISLLIVERGSHWLDRVQGWRKPANELLVVTQHGGEPNREFRARVDERLERLRRHASPVDQVMVVASQAHDPTALLCRAQILGSVLAKLSADVQIVLDFDHHGEGPTQRRMQALADTVAQQFGSPAARIRVAGGCAACALS